MNKTISAFVLTASMIGAPAFAQEASSSFDWTGPYVGLSYLTGKATTLAEYDSSGTGVQAGYLLDRGALVFGAELAYGKLNIDTGFDDTGTSTQLRGLVGYSTGKTLIYAYAGYAQAELVDSVVGQQNDTGVSKGIGARYAVTDKVSLGLDYSTLVIDDFDGSGVNLDSKTWALSVNYRF